MDSARDPFSVAHHAEPSQHVVEVVGDIDIFTAADFGAALERAYGAPRVIIDLSRCEYIDSTGISALFRWQQSTQGKLRLVVGQQHKIRRILQVSRVDKFIEIFPSVEAAKA
jgi:anti-sigma B factor antagonist